MTSRRRCGRAPDHPGVDGALLEGFASVGRRQIDDLDIGVFQACLLERANEQVMHVRAFVQRDLLALQIGDRLVQQAAVAADLRGEPKQFPDAGRSE